MARDFVKNTLVLRKSTHLWHVVLLKKGVF